MYTCQIELHKFLYACSYIDSYNNIIASVRVYYVLIDDYHHFATLYLAVQFLNLIMSCVFTLNLYHPAAALRFILALAPVL